MSDLFALSEQERADLNNLFAQTKKRPTDFIRWAAEMGATIYPSAVSNQMAGRVSISEWAAIAYRAFFSLPE